MLKTQGYPSIITRGSATDGLARSLWASIPAYLFLQTLNLGGHTLVAFMLVAGAQPADECLALAAEELLQVLVLGADLLGQVTGRCNEFVLLQGLLGLVRLQVGFTVGAHAHQAAFDCLSLSPLTHVAGYG